MEIDVKARQLIFASDRNGNLDIFVMNDDSSDVIQLTSHAADDFGPVWSPDGSQIAFYTFRDGNNEIYVMNADGSEQTNVSQTTRFEFDPH